MGQLPKGQIAFIGAVVTVVIQTWGTVGSWVTIMQALTVAFILWIVSFCVEKLQNLLQTKRLQVQ